MKKLSGADVLPFLAAALHATTTELLNEGSNYNQWRLNIHELIVLLVDTGSTSCGALCLFSTWTNDFSWVICCLLSLLMFWDIPLLYYWFYFITCLFGVCCVVVLFFEYHLHVLKILLYSSFPLLLFSCMVWVGSAYILNRNHHIYILQYETGEPVVLWVNKVGPYDNPQETYNYYSLPFCRPGENPVHKWGGLGEVLGGNELIDSELQIKFKRMFSVFL